MVVTILKTLMVLFILSSVIHGVLSWIGRSFNNVETKEKYKAILIGFHTTASLKEYILPNYLFPALFFLWIRNISFILFIFTSILEYLLR